MSADRDCERVLERYRGYLRMLAESRLDRRLRAKIDASDIVQETMLQAYKAWGDLRGTSEGERIAWLRQILMRTLLHAVRDFGRAKRNVAREQPLVKMADHSSLQLEALLAADQTSPSQAAVKAEELLRVADALAELPEEQRSAVLAYYWRGATVKEIGAELDRSGPAVAGLIYRGVKKLNQRRGWRCLRKK
jgi:RNA polymerase sigma-70 factor (ECF subfamily)